MTTDLNIRRQIRAAPPRLRDTPQAEVPFGGLQIAQRQQLTDARQQQFQDNLQTQQNVRERTQATLDSINKTLKNFRDMSRLQKRINLDEDQLRAVTRQAFESGRSLIQNAVQAGVVSPAELGLYDQRYQQIISTHAQAPTEDIEDAEIIEEPEVEPERLAEIEPAVGEPAEPLPAERPPTTETVFDQRGRRIGERNISTGRVTLDKPKDIKPAQRLTAGFAARIEDSDRTISQLERQFAGLGAGITGAFPEALKPEDRRLYDQAIRNFLTAVLRRESGASISDSEFVMGNLQYFPVVGDSDDVLAQKRRNRQIVFEAYRLEAGDAFTELKTEMPPLAVEIDGQTFGVGQIVKNARGQEGRVEADGTITLLED